VVKKKVVDILFPALSSMNAIIRLLPEMVEDATLDFHCKVMRCYKIERRNKYVSSLF
jgi:hypothetical protein